MSRATAAAALQLGLASAPPRHGEPAVVRGPLLARLDSARETPVILVVAPAAYGKTTLLAQWADRDERPVAWLDLTPADNDPDHLSASLARALGRLGRRTAVGGRRRSHHAVGGKFALVLDGAHVVRSRASLALLESVADGLPPGCQLAVALRGETWPAVARLRAQRALVELRAADLAMTGPEAAGLVAATSANLSGSDIAALLRRTEGWPAALTLAAGAGDGALEQLARALFLDGCSDGVVSFLRRTSVLATLTGPACDALLQRSDSTRRLRELERGGLPLVALDRHDESYRLHRLLADALRADLRRPGARPERALHRRASRWFAGAGDRERAIHHALAAGDCGRAAELVWADARAGAGHRALGRRLEVFSADQLASSPLLAAAAAGMSLADGRLDLVRRWVATAETASNAKTATRCDSLGATLLIGRAVVAEDGLGQMAENARRGFLLEPRGSPWRSLCCLLEGVSLHLTGSVREGQAKLEEAVRRGSVSAPLVEALALAQLAVLAAEEGDIARARDAAARAGRRPLGDYPQAALVSGLAALAHADDERFDEARLALRRALGLLARLSEPPAWYEAEVAIALGRAALRLGDLGQARRLLAQASRAGRRTREAVVLRRWLLDSWKQVSARSDAAGAPPALTPAELRVLPLLASHLSFREIGGRLFVSPNTVKTQALAVYRKLDASSRSQAVRRARESGLLA